MKLLVIRGNNKYIDNSAIKQVSNKIIYAVLPEMSMISTVYEEDCLQSLQ